MPPCLPAVPATVLLEKATEDTVAGTPRIIYAPHAVEALRISHPTRHLSASRITLHETTLLLASISP